MHVPFSAIPSQLGSPIPGAVFCVTVEIRLRLSHAVGVTCVRSPRNVPMRLGHVR